MPEDAAAESRKTMETKQKMLMTVILYTEYSLPGWNAKVEVVLSPVCWNGGLYILYEIKFKGTICFLFQILKTSFW